MICILGYISEGVIGQTILQKLEEIAHDLCRDFSITDVTVTNYKYYNQISNGILAGNVPVLRKSVL